MIGHKYYGAVGYADDTFLVAPSIYALNKMCDICLEFAYDLQFNLSKCQLIKYGCSTDCPFYFDGHIVGPGTHQAMAKDMCHDFIWHVNALSANFGCSFCTNYAT